MASLVILNDDGTVFRKLGLVSLPDDYQVPDGKLVSWQMSFETSSRNFLDALGNPKTPRYCYFYLGSAWAEIKLEGWKMQDGESFCHYSVSNYTLTVQGKSAKDVMALRNMVLQSVNVGARWKVRNNFNPRPLVSIWRKLTSPFSR